MMVYIYLILLLLVLLSVLFGIGLCLKGPKKIRALSSIVLIFLLLRYISLFIMYINNNLSYMYIMKSVYFLHFVCIPISGAIILYILLRRDRINFLHITLGALAFIIIYFFMFSKVTVYISMINDSSLGYSMNLQHNFWYIDIIYLVINMFFLMLAINAISNSNINKMGIILVVCSALCTTVAIILPYIGIEIMPQYIWGEFMWISTLNYCLHKVKKR
ncbi:hypothetical protein [Clostridium pasteurianum]|uniref:Histidine kinase N-terminal 7TM region domain-containing protein n=1 Tax=Clostridium pasteurianum BC1 TaxID=86416 RepID=R4K9D0_CLOPA|nr:hypothetical protein [Clostridium pasteurianum]AGK96250.1 hypothetical protein Clopa_1261 [Clostridium pasteurianum BC1]